MNANKRNVWIMWMEYCIATKWHYGYNAECVPQTPVEHMQYARIRYSNRCVERQMNGKAQQIQMPS